MHRTTRSLLAFGLTALCCTLVMALPVRAQTTPPTELAALISEAMQANPELEAAKARLLAAGQRPAQARALADPVLGVSLRNVDFPEPTVGIEPMSTAGISFSQALPGPGKRDLREAVAVEGIDVAAARVQRVRRRLIREIAQTYFELGFLGQAIAIISETKRLLAELEQTSQARYSVGDGIQQDVLKAQVETSILLQRLIQLQEERQSAENRINRLVGRPASTPIGRPAAVPVPQPDLDLGQLQREAAALSAALVERDQQVERQERMLDLARGDGRSDYTVSGAWMHRGGLPDLWQLNLSVSLPIRQDQRQSRAIEEAAEELSAVRLERRDAGLAVAEAMRDRYLKIDRATKLMALFRDGIIPQAGLSLESALAGYSVGNVDFLTVLDNVVTLLTYRLELERETSNYMIGLAGIEEHIGRSLGATPKDVWAGDAGASGPDETSEDRGQTPADSAAREGAGR